MSEQHLRDKTVKGVGWSAVDNITQYAVSFIVGIVLARLLSPDDYGLLGIIGIFTAVCTSIINGGFNSALIRKVDASDDDYNTVFFSNIFLSVLLYIIIFVCSPYIANFFEREELTSLTRVTSFTLIIGAFSLVQQTKLTKRIDFKTQTKITLLSSVISGATGITMAFLHFGVWSLVFQGLILQLSRTILFCFYNKWIPQLKFSTDSFHTLFGFGWKMMVANILDSLWKELNKVIIGKFYSPATLGQYTRAGQFSQLFSTNLSQVFQKVTYPVLSSIQDEKDRLLSAYRKTIKLTMFISFACMFALASVSDALIFCLIGDKWHEAATYLPLICAIGSLYPLHSINLNMLQVKGRSDLYLILEIIKKIISLGPLFIGAFVGIKPMLIAGLFTNIICFFLNSHYSGKFIGYSSVRQLLDIIPSFLIAFTVSMVVFFESLIPISYWFVLPIQIISWTFLFVLFCNMFKINEYSELIQLVKPYLKIIKSPKNNSNE